MIRLLTIASSAFAKAPPEVLKPYKVYVAALENGDKKTALKNIRKAWNEAEALLGDSKTTADLAHNYADLQSYENSEEAIRGYSRAIELSTRYS